MDLPGLDPTTVVQAVEQDGQAIVVRGSPAEIRHHHGHMDAPVARGQGDALLLTLEGDLVVPQVEGPGSQLRLAMGQLLQIDRQPLEAVERQDLDFPRAL